MSTSSLAKSMVSTRYEDIPKAVTKATKMSILDTLGVMLPPTTLEKSCTALYEMIKEEGGKKECTLVGFGGKTSCLMAAFVNGSLTHPMDYDDSTDLPAHHPTACTLPAALAIAERVGGVSGKDFITAITLGNDLGVRMASCPHGDIMNYAFFPITTFGVFGAAAAAGKLLRLSEVEMQNALGLAFHRIAGVTEAVAAPESDLRAIRDAFTNKEGAIAALMASRGIAACKDSVEKLFKVYYSGHYDLKPLTAELGKRFRGAEASLKPWPACRGTHGYIQAILQIMKEHNIKPGEVKEVLLTVSVFGADRLCEPLEAKQNPTLSIGAKFSLPFVAAIALTKGEVKIAHFLPHNLKDAEVLAMAKKIKYEVDPAFTAVTPAQTKISTRGGKSYSLRVDTPHGNPQDPLSLEEVIAKFKDCASYSKKRLTSAKVDQLIDTILKLESVTDVKELTAILS